VLYLNASGFGPCAGVWSKVQGMAPLPKVELLKSYSVNEANVSSIPDDSLIDKIRKNKSGDLPIFLSSEVFRSIVSEYVTTEWIVFTHTLLDEVSTVLRAFITWVIESVNPLNVPGLKVYFEVGIECLLKSLAMDMSNESIKWLNNEVNPYTQNDYLIENVRKRQFANLESIIHTSKDSDGNISASLIENFILKNQAMSIDESMAEQMQIALAAYGKVASKRVIDSVPMIIERHGIATIPDRLRQLFSFVTDTELRSIMVENEGVAEERNRNEKLVDAMNKATQALEDLMMGI
jgi:hypothetical protein